MTPGDLAARDHDADGDCFAVAMRLVLANPDAFLCHGVASGRGGDALGLQCWHAWVELDGDHGTVCMDRSRGQDDTMYRADYYELGHLEHVNRYTHDEAVAMLRTGTPGPWL